MAAFKEFHARSIKERDSFWAEQARLIDWQAPPERTLDYSRPPFARWFIGGRFTTLGGQPRNNLGVVNSAGVATAWTANVFGSSANPAVSVIKIAGQRLYVGGNFTSVGGQLRNNIAAVRASDAQVIEWAPDLGGLSSEVRTITVDRGIVYAGGSFYAAGNQPAAGLAAIAEEIYRVNLPLIAR